MREPTIPTLAAAKLMDNSLLEIQTAMTASLTWLNGSYGKVQRLKEVKDGKVVSYPAIYTGSDSGKGYQSAMPSTHLGNYSFFVIEDGEFISTASRSNTIIDADFGLIFWFDYRSIYPADWKTRTIENVKFEILEFFRTSAFRKSQIQISNSFEEAENIFRGFDHREIENQFLMRPFGGIRINGKIRVSQLENC